MFHESAVATADVADGDDMFMVSHAPVS